MVLAEQGTIVRRTAQQLDVVMRTVQRNLDLPGVIDAGQYSVWGIFTDKNMHGMPLPSIIVTALLSEALPL